MKVAAFCAYYAPELFSERYLIEDLFEGLIERGHTVVVYTPTPCRGITEDLKKEYNSFMHEELFGGKLIINRFHLYAESPGVINRAIRYILLNIKLFLIGIRDESDIIYAISTPPTQGLICSLIRKIRKIPFVYGLQDIFPDSLVYAGISKKGSLAWRIGRLIENKTYAGCDKIIVINEDFRKNLIHKNVSENLINIIPNWIDTDRVRPVLEEDNRLFEEFNINRDSFRIVYAGNLGEAQGIDTFLDVADRLYYRKDVSFIIFGDGSRRNRIERRIDKMNNVRLFHLLPKERIPEVYSLGDLLLVSCKPGFGKAAMPSKTLSIMSVARPVLLNYDRKTNLWNLIQTIKCGICTEAGNVDDLYAGIMYAINMSKNELREMGINGRKYVIKNVSKSSCVSAYCDHFERIANLY